MLLLASLAFAAPDPALTQACLESPEACEPLAEAWLAEREGNRARAVRRQACAAGAVASCLALGEDEEACGGGHAPSCEALFEEQRRGPTVAEALALQSACEAEPLACGLLEEYGWRGGWVQGFRLLEGREQGAFGDPVASVGALPGGLVLVQEPGAPLQVFDPATGQRVELLEPLEVWPRLARRDGSELVQDDGAVQARAKIGQVRLVELDGADLGDPVRGRLPFQTNMELLVLPEHVVVDGRLVLDRVAQPSGATREGLEGLHRELEAAEPVAEPARIELSLHTEPGARVAVYTHSARFHLAEGLADAEGRIHFEGLPAGMLEIWALEATGSDSVAVQADQDTEVELLGLDRPVLRGQVRLDGAPVSEGLVYDSTDPNAPRFPVAPDGSYLLPTRVGKASIRVRAEGPAGLSADRTVRFEQGPKVYVLDLDVLPWSDPRVLRIRLIDSRGEPLDDRARVRAGALSQRVVEGQVALLRQSEVGVEALWAGQVHVQSVPVGPLELVLRFETGSLALETDRGQLRVLDRGGVVDLATMGVWPGAQHLGSGPLRLLYWDGERLFEEHLQLEPGEERRIAPPSTPHGHLVTGRAVDPQGRPWIGLDVAATAVEGLPLARDDQDDGLTRLGDQVGLTAADGSFQIWLAPGDRSFRLGNRDIEVRVGEADVDLGVLVLD
jgi:hypothetical protein